MFVWARPQTTSSAKASAPTPTAGISKVLRVDKATLPKDIPSPVIEAFDLSPDGKLLALLVELNTATPKLWLVVKNAKTGATVKELSLGSPGPYRVNYAPHVRFSYDQKFLVVQDMQNVRVLETAGYTVARTIPQPSVQGATVPVSIQPASGSDVFVISFNTGERPPFEVGIDPVVVEIVDVAETKKIPMGQTSDIPQAISPMGALLAVADWNTETPLLSVQILNTQNGMKIGDLNGGFKFPQENAAGDVLGEVMGKFLSEDEFFLTPNESFDAGGNYAGNSIKEVRIADGSTVREFTPANYGPTGEIAVSADRRWFAAVSAYISPANLAKRVDTPAGGASDLLEFSLARSTPVATVKISANGLETSMSGEVLRPVISGDGSLIAVAQDGGVTLFQRR